MDRQVDEKERNLAYENYSTVESRRSAYSLQYWLNNSHDNPGLPALALTRCYRGCFVFILLSCHPCQPFLMILQMHLLLPFNDSRIIYVNSSYRAWYAAARALTAAARCRALRGFEDHHDDAPH